MEQRVGNGNCLAVQVLPLFFVTVIPEMWHQLSLDRINGNGRIVENNLEYSPPVRFSH